MQFHKYIVEIFLAANHLLAETKRDDEFVGSNGEKEEPDPALGGGQAQRDPLKHLVQREGEYNQ